MLIPARNEESNIEEALRSVFQSDGVDFEIVVLDDGSTDGTFALSERLRKLNTYRHRLTVLANPVNQGYGGNQKLGYHYAIEHGFDFVVLVHGDGQYAPEMLPEMLAPLAAGEADVVHGSRMLVARNALKGGMPLYKYVANRGLYLSRSAEGGMELNQLDPKYLALGSQLNQSVPNPFFGVVNNGVHLSRTIARGQLLRPYPQFTEIRRASCRERV